MIKKGVKYAMKFFKKSSLLLNRNNSLPLQTEKKLVIGESCIIDPSVIFIHNENSLIELLGNNRIGRNSEIQPCKNGKITIGFGTSIQDRNIILGDVEFGNFCLTAPNVYISSGRHYFNHVPELYIKDQDMLVHSDLLLSSKHSKKVVIEDDVWIGINSVIMSGITVGRGSVIGANSVVTKDIPPFSVVAGNPAIEIKKRLFLENKNVLKFDIKEDFPNFYKGFCLDFKSRMESTLLGGLFCIKNFSVYLNSNDKQIIIILKPIIEAPLHIVYFNQKLEVVKSEFMSYTFNLNPNSSIHNFNILTENTSLSNYDNVLLIKEIKTI